MDVRFWIGPSVTKSHMAEDGNASLPTAFFADHPNRIDLPQGQSFFIVGGRKSIVKTIISSCLNTFVGVSGGSVHVTVKTSRGFRKVKRIVQLHGPNDGPGPNANFKYANDTVRLGDLRESLENVLWGSQM